MKVSNRMALFSAGILSASSALALPIDWNGSLGFDSNIITNSRLTKDSCTVGNGSECIKEGNDNARYQSYLLKLNPSLLVNDSATIKGELSTGNFRGGFLGGNSTWGEANSSSMYNVHSDGNATLAINQLYAEIYADTGLFKVGKFSKHFGLGAVLNNGNKSWDRFYSQYDGVEVDFKLGNFTLTPTWAKIYSSPSMPNGSSSSLEKAISVLYNNSASNMKFGLYYGLRETEKDSPLQSANAKQDLNIIDIFVEKSGDNYSVAIEVPMITGKVHDSYGTGNNASIEANAVILESYYLINPRWKVGFNAGMVSGDDASTNGFEGMYLNPNYKIANMMFRYDFQGFTDANRNIFQAAISNATYYNFNIAYIGDNWTYRTAFTMASSAATAESGKSFYDHENRTLIANSAEDQSNDLGYEFDLGLDYKWNPSVLVSGNISYFKVGDYYSFDNDSTTQIKTTDITSYQLSVSLNF